MIKILGLLKSFAFVMRSICGAFFQKGIDQAKKKALLAIQGVQKMKNDLSLVRKLSYMDMINIFGLLKRFVFVMRSIFWSPCMAKIAFY